MADTPNSYTTNLNVGKYNNNDAVPGYSELNNMRDKFDTLCPLHGLDADKPSPDATPYMPPIIYYATDTERLYLITSTQTIMVANLSGTSSHTHPESEITDLDKYTEAEVDAFLTDCITNRADEIDDLSEKVTLHNDDLFIIEDSENGNIKKKVKKSNVGGGGGGFEYTVDILAGKWNYPISNPAPLEKDTGTNGTIYRQLFDDSTEEFVEFIIQIPTDIDASGTVTFEVYGYPVTWVTGKNIKLKLYHSAKADNESWDAAYSTKESGDLVLNTSGQDYIDLLSFSETVVNLGWTAGDQVRIKLSRIDASANDLAGDFGITHFRIRIPRA